MDDSMSQDDALPAPLASQAWKAWAGWACSALLAALFLVAGVWKLSDPLATEVRMTQALIPAQLALATALAAGIAEVWAGVLLLVPRWRRWGAWLCALMLVAFMAYFAIFYTRLQGADCSCFPWLKRVVGPGFFVSDAAMLALAIGAGVWSRRPGNWKQALLVLGVIAVFAAATFGATVARHSGIEAPANIAVEGKQFPMNQGRVFVYFFDPQCMHCFAAAKAMSQYAWQDVQVVAVATVNPQWGAGFLRDTGLKAGLSTDLALLRSKFQFVDPPYGVAIEKGRQAAAFAIFDEQEPLAGLRKLGWIR